MNFMKNNFADKVVYFPSIEKSESVTFCPCINDQWKVKKTIFKYLLYFKHFKKSLSHLYEPCEISIISVLQ